MAPKASDDGEAGPSMRVTETSVGDLSTTASSRTNPNFDSTSRYSSQEELQIPRFIQDTQQRPRFHWLPRKPRKWANAVIDWTAGPEPPRRQHISPIFPGVQEWPIKVLDRWVAKKRARLALLVFYYFIWILTFTLVYKHSISADVIESYGAPDSISCGATYWQYKNNCGMDGADCRPFTGSAFAFRCPASCLSYKVLNPRAVGDQTINYSHYVIGGGDPQSVSADGNITKVLMEDGTEATRPVYRGDSFICQAAIHAGLVSNTKGGCGVVKKVGLASSFPGSDSNGVKSITFPSYFPLSMQFMPDISCNAVDLRWHILGVNVAFSIVFSLFVTSPALFFWTESVALFLHTGLVSDVPSHVSTADLFSDLASKGLPAALAAYIFYRFAIRRTLDGLTAQFEKTVLWLGAAWVGALTNYTFDFIPIQRLTPHDLKAQPGAVVALIIIICVLLFIVVGQIWYLRLEGRLRRFIRLYLLIGAIVLICVFLPDLSLRIHHYIMALIFMPGTSLQTRPSLLYQGVLVGFYVNGLARWGWDSVLQTERVLRGDGSLNLGVPFVDLPIIDLGDRKESISFNLTFHSLKEGARADGISVLVNDVERYRGYLDDLVLGVSRDVNSKTPESMVGGKVGSPLEPNNNGFQSSVSKRSSVTELDGPELKSRDSAELPDHAPNSQLQFTWNRKSGLAEPEYFRFAYMAGSRTWDYTKAGVWLPDGRWLQMPEGAVGE